MYLATVHFQTPKWIDVQLGYVNRHIMVPLRTFAVLDGISKEHHAKFDHVVPASGTHEGRLNLLAGVISAEASPNDIILFLDGDAFPIADPMPTIERALDTTSLVAVRRDEVQGDKQPHPCFCAVRVGEWQRLHGDWSTGFQWETNQGNPISDVGGNLLGCLERTGSQWTPLLRSNTRNDHPLWFGVYGGIVYHHGSGFRRPWSRVDVENISPGLRGVDRPVVGPAIRYWNDRRRKHESRVLEARNEREGEKWFELLQRDPEFYKQLL